MKRRAELVAFAIAVFAACLAGLLLLPYALRPLLRWEVALVLVLAIAALLALGYREDRNHPGEDE